MNINILVLSKFEPPHDKTNKTAYILRSAQASAQSDWSLLCPHEERLGPELPNERTAKTDQTRRMLRLN